MNNEDESTSSLGLSEINGQLLALTLLAAHLLQTLAKNGTIADQDTDTILFHCFLRAKTVCKDLGNEIPLKELRRLERQAIRTLTIISSDTTQN